MCCPDVATAHSTPLHFQDTDPEVINQLPDRAKARFPLLLTNNAGVTRGVQDLVVSLASNGVALNQVADTIAAVREAHHVRQATQYYAAAADTCNKLAVYGTRREVMMGLVLADVPYRSRPCPMT